MSERKVLNKYYPPDFDPVKLREKAREVRQRDRRRGKVGPKQMNVRFMMPFTMCCSHCNEFSYVGTKFNSRIEKVQDEDYLGIIIWRIYGKCPSCSCEFAFKTDPQNTAYILEFGGTRTYDPHRDASVVEESVKDRFKREMEGDVMKSLEHKTYTTANELLDLEQLDELRRLNKRMLRTHDITEDVLIKLNRVDRQHGSFVDVPGAQETDTKKQEEEETELENFKTEQEYFHHKKRRKEQSEGGTATAAPSGTATAAPSGTATAAPSGAATAAPSSTAYASTGVPSGAATLSPTLPHHLRRGAAGQRGDSSDSDSDEEQILTNTTTTPAVVAGSTGVGRVDDSSSDDDSDLRQMLLVSSSCAKAVASTSQATRAAAKIKVLKNPKPAKTEVSDCWW
eukprot:Lankesteria_metandrocarpae@DN3813_c0_g1_i1.p1